MTDLAAPPTTRTRVVSWDDPLLGATLAQDLSGLEYLQLIRDGEVAPPPLAVLLGMSLDEVEPGRAVFGLDIGEHQYNPIGSVHGGVFATLLDSVMGYAVHSTLPAGRGYTTLDLTVHLSRPLTVSQGRVRAEGEIVTSGRRVATATGRIVDDEGRVYAHGSTTCLVFDR